jgi:hypothetical protein
MFKQNKSSTYCSNKHKLFKQNKTSINCSNKTSLNCSNKTIMNCSNKTSMNCSNKTSMNCSNKQKLFKSILFYHIFIRLACVGPKSPEGASGLVRVIALDRTEIAGRVRRTPISSSKYFKKLKNVKSQSNRVSNSDRFCVVFS